MIQKIFYQSSMPRSGSTLFQNIMAQNNDFYASPTSGLLELLYGARLNFSNSPEFKAQDNELMKKAFIEFCNKGINGYYGAITDKKYVIDKSRGWGIFKPFLNTIYPNPKVICMVRDLRSIICSYEKIYRKNQMTINDPIRNDSTAQGTTVHKRVDEWVNPQNTIGRAVERIFEIMRQGYDNEILFVKFEDLCLRPEMVMGNVYEYLELPFFKHDFDNIEQVTKEDDSIYGLSRDLHTIKPHLSLPNPDYNKVLGEDISDWIYQKYNWYFNRFNYSK
jgi:sulfotransferase